MSHFKTITSENYSKPTSVNNVYQSQKKLRRPKKQLEDKIFRVIEDRIIRDVKNLFEQEEDYYKPARVGDFYSNNYIKYESNGNRNQTLLIKEYLDGIKPYLKDIINSFKKSDTWKIQFKIAMNFISSKDTDEEFVMHSSDNIEIMIYNKADEVIQNVFHFSLNIKFDWEHG